MLVLTRRPGEEIVIGGNIRIVIVECNGKNVRVGVAAPSAVTVDRREVHERRQLLRDSCVPPASEPGAKEKEPLALCGPCRQPRAARLCHRIPR
jgi:carbon storage regulator